MKFYNHILVQIIEFLDETGLIEYLDALQKQFISLIDSLKKKNTFF